MVQSAFDRLLHKLAPAGAGYIGPEWKFRIGRADGSDSAFLPDVAYIAKDRIRALPENQREESLFAPDIAVEVRSPGERVWLRDAKIVRY